MFKKGNKESIKGGQASAKSRFKGKSRAEISKIMSNLAKKSYEKKKKNNRRIEK